MKRILFSIFAAGSFFAATAIPSFPGLIRFTQPDGSVIELQIVGDEHGHVTYSVDGHIVVNADGWMEYADFDEAGFPVPSGITVGRNNSSAMKMQDIRHPEQQKRWIEMVMDNRAERLSKIAGTCARIAVAADNDSEGNDIDDGRLVPLNFGRTSSSFPVLGEQKSIVILVEYQDVKFQYGDFDYFNRMLNEEGFSDFGSLGSARDWFVFNSNRKFLPDFDVFGVVTLPKDRKYYGGNDRFGDDKNSHMMVLDAMRILDDTVDFSQYDRDGDGIIDNVFVFYAGQGEHDSNISEAVWPHSWNMADACPDEKFFFDGVQLLQYGCTCEYPNGYQRPDGIGTFVHEFSHVIGLPDLYNTIYGGGFTPGEWSVLDQGPYNNDRLTPPNYSSYEKCALGWVDMLPLAPGTVEIPDFSDSNIAFALPTEKDCEFFFFENRQQKGNDAFIPGHGMLVWHIDYNERAWDQNVINNNANHQRVDLIEADNKKSQSTRAGDAFPGASNVSEFTFSSQPALRSWAKKNVGVNIVNIEETAGGTIRLNVEKNSDDSSVTAVDVASDSRNVYYDLTGRKISNPSKGIYIVNGKKVLVK